MDKHELRDLDITPEIADQAFHHVSTRLEWALDQRKLIETRAIGLLRTFLSLALAVIGVGVALQRMEGPPLELTAFLAGATPLFLAAACMVVAIWDRDYGSLGSTASWWLRKGVIDGDPSEAAYLTACLTESYQRRIKASMGSNMTAIYFIRGGLVAAVLSPVALAVAL